jgi:Xaa-Pro aminopeptidase
MREAGRISGNCLNEIIRRGLRTEKDIETTLEYLFRISGCEKSAYVPVVAGGSVSHFPRRYRPRLPQIKLSGLLWLKVECFNNTLYH